MLWAGGDSPTRGTRLTRENRNELVVVSGAYGARDLVSREAVWRSECRSHLVGMVAAIGCVLIGCLTYTLLGGPGPARAGDMVGTLSVVLVLYSGWRLVVSWRERRRLLEALRALDAVRE